MGTATSRERSGRSYLTLVILIFVAAVVFIFSSAAWAGIVGSVHDMNLVTQDPEVGVCAYCHLPHKAQGERLWKSAPSGPKTGWGSRTIAQLCYMCHNATGGGYGAHDVTSTAYSDESHGYRIAMMPLTPTGVPETIEPGAFLPYIETLMDCTTCHDPHDNSYPPFLRDVTIDQLCWDCHHRRWPGIVGSGNLADDGLSYHPSSEYIDLADNGPTNLEQFPDTLQVEAITGNWRLGPHRTGGKKDEGGIGCQTCHPVHGWEDVDTGLGVPPGEDLLRHEFLGAASSPLCQACHQGGDVTETVGVGSDHPINVHSPETDVLFSSGLMWYPSGWPPGANREPLCVSCHDIHGGMGGTSLLRTGGDDEWWCFSCHRIQAIQPPYHHSNIYNDDDGATITSIVECRDCHGAGGEWNAHNGFTAFLVPISANDSALCEACHFPENPLSFDFVGFQILTGRVLDFENAVFPADHGVTRGTDSHMINEADDDSTFNTRIFSGVWPTSGGNSEYGLAGEIICESCHNILTNIGPLTAQGSALYGGWQANLLLEPYEDNDPGVGMESPDYIPGITGDSLCRACHTDDVTGYVHYPGAHTIPNYQYNPGETPYGRTASILLTTPKDPSTGPCPEVSSADRLGPEPTSAGYTDGAPGAFSYPRNNAMDCDSCHRPHGADDRALNAELGHVIVEFSLGLPKTDTCQECHDTQIGCR